MSQDPNSIIDILSLNEHINGVSESQIIIFVDENTQVHCLPILQNLLPKLKNAHSYCLPSGEVNKNLDSCELAWAKMSELALSRHALVINLGGGVLCDMGGLIASLFKRGVKFINIPTTLLAMVDAAYGGKVAVDFNGLKNQIGLFSYAEKIVLHRDFLQTLAHEELTNGFAEMLKHALITDRDYWLHLNKINVSNLSRIDIVKSLQIKQSIVSIDPTEQNERKMLNFGHTVGHAIESLYLDSPNPLKHGQSVAIGMLIESLMSRNLGLLSDSDFVMIAAFFKKTFNLPVDLHLQIDHLFEYMKNDKKNTNNEVKCVLLKAIGHAVVDQTISKNDVQKAFNEIYFNFSLL